jgi:hypothetical protein
VKFRFPRPRIHYAGACVRESEPQPAGAHRFTGRFRPKAGKHAGRKN